MQIDLTFVPQRGEMTLPLPYNHLLQGLIYHRLERILGAWLHDEAYQTQSRRYKLLVYGQLTGVHRVSPGQISFRGPFRLTVRSVNRDILASFAEHLVADPRVSLGSEGCTIESVSFVPDPAVDLSRPVRLRALSPITVYSTLTMPDLRKKTYYYAPSEADWGEQIIANLMRKAQASGIQESDTYTQPRWIRPVSVRPSDHKILTVRGTVIKGWMGVYEALLPTSLFWLGYNGGFGSKNMQGFGLMEVLRAT